MQSRFQSSFANLTEFHTRISFGTGRPSTQIWPSLPRPSRIIFSDTPRYDYASSDYCRRHIGLRFPTLQCLTQKLMEWAAPPNPWDEGTCNKPRRKRPWVRCLRTAMGAHLGRLVGLLQQSRVCSCAKRRLRPIHGLANDIYGWLWKFSRGRRFSGAWWLGWIAGKAGE